MLFASDKRGCMFSGMPSALDEVQSFKKVTVPNKILSM